MEPRLKTHVWITAQVRLCDRQFIPFAVVRKGDPDAGAVLVRLLRADGRAMLLRRHIRADGTSAWAPAGGGEVEAAAADAHVAREIARDPDLWVIEVDDPKERYWPDRPMD